MWLLSICWLWIRILTCIKQFCSLHTLWFYWECVNCFWRIHLKNFLILKSSRFRVPSWRSDQNWSFSLPHPLHLALLLPLFQMGVEAEVDSLRLFMCLSPPPLVSRNDLSYSSPGQPEQSDDESRRRRVPKDVGRPGKEEPARSEGPKCLLGTKGPLLYSEPPQLKSADRPGSCLTGEKVLGQCTMLLCLMCMYLLSPREPRAFHRYDWFVCSLFKWEAQWLNKN